MLDLAGVGSNGCFGCLYEEDDVRFAWESVGQQDAMLNWGHTVFGHKFVCRISVASRMDVMLIADCTVIVAIGRRDVANSISVVVTSNLSTYRRWC
jgi:hypothetical protein